MAQLTEEQKLEKLVDLALRINIIDIANEQNFGGIMRGEYGPQEFSENANRINRNEKTFPSRARQLVNLVAKHYKDNPDELKRHFKEFNWDTYREDHWDLFPDEQIGADVTPQDRILSGIATSAYYQITGDIQPILKYGLGGWGATITSEEPNLEIGEESKDKRLKFAKIKSWALPGAKLRNFTANYSLFEPFSGISLTSESSCLNSEVKNNGIIAGTFLGESNGYSSSIAPTFEYDDEDSEYPYPPSSRCLALVGEELINTNVDKKQLLEEVLLEEVVLPIVKKINPTEQFPLSDTLRVLADNHAEYGKLNGIEGNIEQLTAQTKQLTQDQIAQVQNPLARGALTVLHRMYATEQYKRAS